MSSSDEETTLIMCLFCTEELKSTFYVCSKLHFSCSHCSSLGFCSKCHTILSLCCSLAAYEQSPKGPLFQLAGGDGPIIALSRWDDESEGYGTSNDNSRESIEIRETRMYNCHDCGKFVTSTRLLEHYEHEHPRKHICPLPPGSCLSFRLKMEDVPFQKIKQLQIIKVFKQKQFYSGSDNFDGSDDKFLFIMATRVPYYKSKSTLLLWLASSYQGCTFTYSIEARSEMDNIAAAMFTGSPVGPKAMEEVMKGNKKCEELGQYLCVKDSLLKELQKVGNGVVINTLIHDVMY